MSPAIRAMQSPVQSLVAGNSLHDSETAQPPISVRSLSRSFGSAQALDHVDFDVPQGAIYALVGPNGAGKTTLVKILLNIIRPSSGTAAVLGKSSTHIVGDAFTRIGYVSENQELPEWMTVTQLLSYLRPFYPQWDITLEEQLVRQFDLPPDRKLKHLSRGQRMMAALLSVLPYCPSLIVLDEPFSGLDPLVRDELIESLLERATQDSNPPTILISSHDLAEIESLASHIGYLDRGRLLFSEEISSLSSRFREVIVTLNPTAALPLNSGSSGAGERSAPGIATSSQTVNYPASWLLPETGASMVRFIHSQADTEPVHDQIAAHFPIEIDTPQGFHWFSHYQQVGSDFNAVNPYQTLDIFMPLSVFNRIGDTSVNLRLSLAIVKYQTEATRSFIAELPGFASPGRGNCPLLPDGLAASCLYPLRLPAPVDLSAQISELPCLDSASITSHPAHSFVGMDTNYIAFDFDPVATSQMNFWRDLSEKSPPHDVYICPGSAITLTPHIIADRERLSFNQQEVVLASYARHLSGKRLAPATSVPRQSEQP